MKHIPNIFTLLNLFFGCLALVFVLQTESYNITSYQDGTSSFNLPEKIALASIFIFLAAAVDFLDGFVARLFKASSELGKQLDSLADVVSFGVAPGAILYQLLRASYMQQPNGLYVPILYLLPAFVYSCAGAYRLAKFNVDTSQANGFKGVPIPACGLLIASFPLIISGGNNVVNELLVSKWFLYTLIIILSALMISNLPLMALKFKNVSLKDNLPKYLITAIALTTALIFQWVAVPIVFVTYLILSLIFKNKLI